MSSTATWKPNLPRWQQPQNMRNANKNKTMRNSDSRISPCYLGFRGFVNHCKPKNLKGHNIFFFSRILLFGLCLTVTTPPAILLTRNKPPLQALLQKPVLWWMLSKQLLRIYIEANWQLGNKIGEPVLMFSTNRSSSYRFSNRMKTQNWNVPPFDWDFAPDFLSSASMCPIMMPRFP